jgi:predicted RNA-binding Zn-ribbon protein involved in translation (DUF1610 family)
MGNHSFYKRSYLAKPFHVRKSDDQGRYDIIETENEQVIGYTRKVFDGWFVPSINMTYSTQGAAVQAVIDQYEARRCPSCGGKLRFRVSVEDYVCAKCGQDLILHSEGWNAYPHMRARELTEPDDDFADIPY